MSVRERFKVLRERKNISQTDLAEKSKISNGMICRFERGKNDISVNNLLQLLRCIKVSPAELFEDDNRKQVKPAGPEKHTIPILGSGYGDSPVREIHRAGDYAECYAVINKNSGLFPMGSISIINARATAVDGDVIAYLGDDGRLYYDKYKPGNRRPYCGVVIDTEWSYKRAANG